MIRRSFRIGIRVGLLAGVVVALYKLAQARKVTEPLPATPRRAGGAPGPARPDPWPPVAAPEPQPAAVVETPPPPPAPVVETPAPAPTPPPPPPAPVEEAVKKAAGAVKKAAPKKATKKATKKKAAATRAWVEAQGAVCPLSHPIKAKMSSRIYHLPGMLAYTRTKPDRCYATEAAAKRDGFTPAKR